MRTSSTNTSIIDGYIGLLDNLSTTDKLDLISKLTVSVKTDLTKKSQFKESFGAFVPDSTAEDLIEEIRSSRVFNRAIEPF